MADKKVKVREGLKVSREHYRKMKKKAGGSNVGDYKTLSKKDFCGPAGGAPKGSYPVNSKKRARAALSYARNAPNPEGIKKCVYRKFPEFKKNKKQSLSP